MIWNTVVTFEILPKKLYTFSTKKNNYNFNELVVKCPPK